MKTKNIIRGAKPAVKAAGLGSINKTTTRYPYQEMLTKKVRNRSKKQYVIPLQHDFVALQEAFVEEHGVAPKAAFWAYLRVSTAGQDDGERTALEDQLREIANQVAKHEQAIIACIYLDVASGMHVERPALQAMVKTAEEDPGVAK